MNENEDIARWFAAAVPPEPSEPFIVAVRTRIEREKRRAKFVAIGSLAIFALAIALVPVGVVTEVLDAVRFAQGFLLTLPGIVASVACALALSAWVRLADA